MLPNVVKISRNLVPCKYPSISSTNQGLITFTHRKSIISGITSISRPSSAGSRGSQESNQSNISILSESSFLKGRVRNLLSRFSDRTKRIRDRIDIPMTPSSSKSGKSGSQDTYSHARVLNDDDDVIVVETKGEGLQYFGQGNLTNILFQMPIAQSPKRTKIRMRMP